MALTFFCASRARRRCHFQLLQPLHCQNACFADGVTDWHSHARWRSLFSVFPVLGGVAIFNFCNPSAAGMPLLFIWNSVAFPCCMRTQSSVLPMPGGVAVFNACNPLTATIHVLYVHMNNSIPILRAACMFCVLPTLNGAAMFKCCDTSQSIVRILVIKINRNAIRSRARFKVCYRVSSRYCLNRTDYMFFIIIKTNGHTTARAWPHDCLLKQP